GYPGVTYRWRLSPAPSLQYASPHPESGRGAAAPRGPSRSLCIQISSPVAASSAATARLVPAVEYTMPPAINGVDSNWNSGRGPSESVLNRQASSSLLKFDALIWSSGAYRVLPRSPP